MTEKKKGRAAIRERMLSLRDGIPEKERAAMSQRIESHLFSLPVLAAARNIMFYVAFRSEVETRSAMYQCLALGKSLVLPVTLAREKRLIPYLVTNLDQELRPGYCSIPEPDPSRTVEFDSRELDVIILPGSSFDHNGGRLGYGGGFYDRFLAITAPRAVRIGLAFSCQITNELSLAPHDQPINYLVTELGAEKCHYHR
ncbi:MAG: 5-formyltetrahydrofolate cyclo-ligase [Proteobacteria bacterium]|nr:5-formyltetrahydrofolate cyclo-ligase [Pseudomonadota bacterium]MBU1687032.1 5-formyltetrahydrofolate cyclo-ligase [Pseudomonadota bacterium]